MKIAVVGAGVSGQYAAMRLIDAGHTVTVLEAKPHPGGLSQTARDGTVVTELDDEGRPEYQTAKLDADQFVNLGPGRLPHHHRRIQKLCRQLGVPLEPYIMSSDANLYADTTSGKKWPRRRLNSDLRGYIAEAAMRNRKLDYEQREAVRAFGDLTPRGKYRGTSRAPGLPLPFDTLAGLGAHRHQFHQPDAYLWQDTMFHPVGGMDQIWRHMWPRVRDRVLFNAPVTRVRASDSGTRVEWRHNGRDQSDLFDWCLSSAALPILSRDVRMQGFGGDYLRAVDTATFAPACKVGWQAEHRFWENDDNQCYGGISYTDHDIWQVWYPSTGWDQQKGTLTGCYNSYATAERFGRMSPADRIDTARQGGTLLHPEIGDRQVVPDENAVAIAWHRVPYQAGGWCHWNPDNPHHEAAYMRLREPHGRFSVIGEQISPWTGWQEGCLETVDRALTHVHDEPLPEPAQHESGVPYTAFLTIGDHPAHTRGAWL